MPAPTARIALPGETAVFQSADAVDAKSLARTTPMQLMQVIM